MSAQAVLARQGIKMADYLLVIDMQADYVGSGKAYPDPALVQAINQKIAAYSSDRVFYVTNSFLWEWSSRKELAANLLKVSDLSFKKRLPSCFSNLDLKRRLKAASSLEFVGVDGNGCIHYSVLGAVRRGYQVNIDLNCIGVLNKRKFAKTIQKWEKMTVSLGDGFGSRSK